MMQIVIEIPESVKQVFDNATEDDIYGCYYDHNSIIGRAIKNGVPLPKGHGRLIDADRLRSMYSINRANFNTVVGIQKWVDHAPTIIEADRSESED